MTCGPAVLPFKHPFEERMPEFDLFDPGKCGDALSGRFCLNLAEIGEPEPCIEFVESGRRCLGAGEKQEPTAAGNKGGNMLHQSCRLLACVGEKNHVLIVKNVRRDAVGCYPV